jgi:hypothetical protein
MGCIVENQGLQTETQVVLGNNFDTWRDDLSAFFDEGLSQIVQCCELLLLLINTFCVTNPVFLYLSLSTPISAPIPQQRKCQGRSAKPWHARNVTWSSGGWLGSPTADDVPEHIKGTP